MVVGAEKYNLCTFWAATTAVCLRMVELVLVAASPLTVKDPTVTFPILTKKFFVDVVKLNAI